MLSERDQHDYAAESGIGVAINKKLLEDYSITISFNTTNTPFILPTCGIYSIVINNDRFILLPISETMALTMVKGKSESPINHRVLYEFTDDEIVKKLNLKAFIQQINEGTGFVVTSNKNELERVKNEYEQIMGTDNDVKGT